MTSNALPDAVAALDEEYSAIDEVASSLTERELLEPSRCLGWTRADLLFHMLLDAQRALVTFHSPHPGPPDTDFVSYWRGFGSADDRAVAHARFVRASAAAHSSPEGIVKRWSETSAAARRAAADATPPFVTTQGRVLATPDFVATLVVEATVHHLDLVHGRPPAERALAVTVATLDGLLEGARPARWGDVDYVLKATGREPLTDDDRAELGAAASSLPLFS